jgi:ketosteroid isomerase-like protein
MTIQLPKSIASYVDAYNARDARRAVACFSEDAVVQDEGKDHRGRKAIGDWIEETIGKYGPRFKAGNVEQSDSEIVVAMTVSGFFPGSPVNLAFHFTIDNDRIAALNIVQA